MLFAFDCSASQNILPPTFSADQPGFGRIEVCPLKSKQLEPLNKQLASLASAPLVWRLHHPIFLSTQESEYARLMNRSVFVVPSGGERSRSSIFWHLSSAPGLARNSECSWGGAERRRDGASPRRRRGDFAIDPCDRSAVRVSIKVGFRFVGAIFALHVSFDFLIPGCLPHGGNSATPRCFLGHRCFTVGAASL